MNTPRSLMSVLMLVAATTIPACKDNGVIVEPPVETARWTSDWQGVWRVTSEGRVCETDSLYASEELDEVICAGEPVADFFDLDSTVTCITITSTKVTVNCSRSYHDSAIGCNVTDTMTATITRTGDTITGTTTFTRSPAANCEYQFGYCVRIPLEGTRLHHKSARKRVLKLSKTNGSDDSSDGCDGSK